MRDQCYNHAWRNWSSCILCNGRIHKKDCQTKRSCARDCCKARHLMLADQAEHEELRQKLLANSWAE